jgi:AcrR family transcriptional regulator
MKTSEKILAKALEMFNERGIEYVGLRELAALLDMRVSNITYYFPTKDDLVNELSLQLSQRNSEVIVAHEELTMQLFMEMLNQVFNNHVAYRCLLLSVVHLMEQNKVMSARYRNTQQVRNATITANIETLVRLGYLKVEEESDIAFLVSSISLISRFWISEAAISFRELSTRQQINHYLSMITKLLWPYSTAKAKREMAQFMNNL